MYDEVCLFGIVFVEEIHQYFQPTTSKAARSVKESLSSDRPHEMNICSVRTEVWQSRRIKFDASRRHSEEYFLDVNSRNKRIRLDYSLQHVQIQTHPSSLECRRSSRSFPRSQGPPWQAMHTIWGCIPDDRREFLTMFNICKSFMVTSREHFPSKTSRIASIPCDDTSCSCISGASFKIFIYEGLWGNVQPLWTVAHKLIACVPELEVRSRWCEFVYKLVDHAGEAGVFVTLKIGFQIILGKTFIDLW